MKLVKHLANLGYGSRKDVQWMFREGRITDAAGEVRGCRRRAGGHRPALMASRDRAGQRTNRSGRNGARGQGRNRRVN